MRSWTSYPKVYNLGHAALDGLFDDPVIVEEKIDGSQFSFGVFPDGTGELALRVRSRGQEMPVDAPEKMFAKGVEAIRAIQPMLSPGWTYRGEYLQKPAHNALVYDRIPVGHTILFDINTDEERYLSYTEKADEARRLGLECVPQLAAGIVATAEELRTLLDATSVLGGQKIEGVVVKPAQYHRFGRDGKCLMGKFVSEAFKEVHKKTWREGNPGPADILTRLGEQYRTPARWQKAIQHLTEAGLLTNDVQDIGPLMRAVPQDIQAEEEAAIKDALFAWAWPTIRRDVTRGLPEWYKQRLLERAFSTQE